MRYAVEAITNLRKISTKGFTTASLDVEMVVRDEDLCAYAMDARLVEVPRDALELIMEDAALYLEEVPGVTVPWHPQMPFPATFFSPSAPVFMRASDGEIAEDISLGGFLLYDGGMQILVYRGARISLAEIVGNSRGISLSPEVVSNTHRLMLVALALCTMCDHASTTIVRTDLAGALRRKLLRDAKLPPHAPVPREYYRVTIEDCVRWQGAVRARICADGPCYRVGHRHDVRAHPRILVERGDLADLDAKRFRSLTKRGYTVWTGGPDDPVDDDLEHLVHKRDIRRVKDGFLAVKLVRVSSHVRGPADRPYIPASWRLKTHAPEIFQ